MCVRSVSQSVQDLQSMHGSFNLINILDLLYIITILLVNSILKKINTNLHILNLPLNEITSGHNTLDTLQILIRLAFDLLLNHGVVNFLSNQTDDILWVSNVNEFQFLVSLYFANIISSKECISTL